MEAAENTPTQRFSAGERYARRYEIDMLRCIFCGYCEEACPEDAIFLGHNFELSDYSRDAFLYSKEQLLVPVGMTNTPGIVRGR
jgi:NADH-quinone oxidoreductase subunit I